MQVVFTPSFMPRILHVWFASWTAGSALMLSVSAWYLLKKRHIEVAKANLKVALIAFVIFATLNLVVFGPAQAIEVTNYQPLKLASLEGLWESQSCAPLFIVGWVNEAAQTTTGISIPCLLSVLAYMNPQATVTGLEAFPADQYPPINLVFQVYHFMFGMGTLFVPIGLLGLWMYWRKRRVFEARWILWLFVITVFLAEMAITAGWWTAEIGRQPWIVYNVLLTSQAVSPSLTATEVAISLVMFIALYTLLFILFIYLLNGKIQAGPEPLEEVESVPVSSLPDTFRQIFRRRGARAS
jgi:cytochrome d ubiquinol oxidase subunit I